MFYRFFKPWLSRIRMIKAYAAGDVTSAIIYAEKCINKDEKDIAALWTLAECYKLEGEYDEAIKYAKRAVEVDPKHLDTLFLLTEIFFDQKEYKLAYEYAGKALSTAQELDTALGPYISKIRETLSSSTVLSRQARSFQLAIDSERKSTKEWVKWALEFIAWYESNNPEFPKNVH